MVTNHDDSVCDHHPTTTRGFTETVNWALKHADLFIEKFALDPTWVNNHACYDELRTYGAIAA